MPAMITVAVPSYETTWPTPKGFTATLRFTA